MNMTRYSCKLLLTVFVLCFSGCAHRAMDRAVASWQNRPAAEVIVAWGKPSEELNVDGKHLLLWNTYDGKLAAADQMRPASRLNTCVRLLEVARNGKIVDGTWDGNDCPGWLSGWSR